MSGISRRQFLRDSSRISSGIAVAGAAGLFAPAVVTRSAAAAALKPVTIWIGVGAAEFMWHVLKGRKIDEKHGISTTIQFMDAHAINQGLLVGETHIGATEPIALAIANNAGRKLTFFAPELWNHTSIIAPASSPATSLKDLVGKRIAALPPLSGIYTSTQVIAAQLGLNFEKDFQVVTGPPPAVLAFLTRGDVDAAVFFEPFVSNLLLSGKYKLILGENAFWKQRTGKNMLFSGLCADQGWLDANHDIARRIVATLLETAKLIQTDPGVFDEYGGMFKFQTPQQLAAAKKRLPPFFASQWGPADAANGEQVVAEAAKLGIIKMPKRKIIVAL